MKDPDTMHDAVEDALRKNIKTEHPTLSKKEQDHLLDERSGEVCSIITNKWMDYGEYLTVEFDTDALTATVVPSE